MMYGAAKNSMMSFPTILKLCLLLLIVTLPNSLTADVELSASVDRNEIQIADPFELEIKLLAPAGTTVLFPMLEKTLGPFEILEIQEKSDVPVAGGPVENRLWSRKLILETIETGQLQIPSVEVTTTQTGQPNKILRTERLLIQVGSVTEPATDLTKFNDIADLHDVDVPKESRRWIWVAYGVATAALFAACMILLVTRKRKSITLTDWALRRLNETSDVSQAESIVRQVIEERFQFAATSLPVEQIEAELKQHSVAESELNNLRELLQLSEKSKFGGLNLPATEEARLVNLAHKLVECFGETRETVK